MSNTKKVDEFIALLYTQYALVKASRQVVFQFMEMQVMGDISMPLSAFNDKTISYLYVHIANTYFAWAGNFALKDSQTTDIMRS